MKQSYRLNPRNVQQRQQVGLIVLGISAIGLPLAQPVIAQPSPIVRSIVLVSTNEPPSFHTIRVTPRYEPRFSDVVGSGALLLNAANEVTGYYFTVGDLNAGVPYAYHFHAAQSGRRFTSCEGDKGLTQSEAAGEVILDLSAIAPLQISTRGFAFVGSASSPITLPSPIPLSEIGYLNIHPALEGTVSPGVICANVRLNPGGFEQSFD